MTRQLRAVDVFAGAGGLSLGLASAGFRITTAVEHDSQAADTYALSHPDTQVVVADVTTVEAKRLVKRLRAPLDLLVGGPPCQGFSIKGPRRGDHPGNVLLGEMVRLAAELRPRAVLIENVVGLTSLSRGCYFDRLVHGLERIDLGDGRHYRVDYEILDAANYGVPQYRKRLFIVAVMPEVTFRWPEPAAGGPLTLQQAIGDLPSESVPPGQAASYPSPSSISSYALKLRVGSPRVLNHHTKRLEDKRQRRVQALDEGQDRRHLPEHLAAGGHETKYRRLRADRPSPTVTAHMGKDLSDFIHPVHNRTLTAREAARLQGFPDAVEFIGSQASQFRQIGNSVPIPLSEALGRALVGALGTSRPARRALSLVSTSINIGSDESVQTGELDEALA